MKIPELFKGIDIKPSLLHGDLWSGNVADMDDGPGLLKIKMIKIYFFKKCRQKVYFTITLWYTWQSWVQNIVENLQSNQVKRALQDYINELIIRILNPVLTCFQ